MEVFEALCADLGVLLKLAKKIAPTQVITIIGWVFDSVAHTVSISSEKREKIIDVCQQCLELKSLTLHQVQILGGNLNHAAPVIPGSSLRLQWCGRAAAMAHKYGTYVLSKYDCRQLYWWLIALADPTNLLQLTAPKLRQVTNIWTDASDYFGGSLTSDGFWAAYVWSPKWSRCAIFCIL